MPSEVVFISSVRRGLEDERDALPAMIKAIGLLPKRFEDFTAQPLPSRDACLAGVESADVYLLVLGPHYGEPLADTGLSPTEEEWAVAKRRGIPILVFRKEGIDLDGAQEAFVQRVENYVIGRFRDTFSTVADLLPKVVGKLREIQADAAPLVWTSLGQPVSTSWILNEDRLRVLSVGATLELHLHPVDSGARVMSTAMEAMPDRLARLGREHQMFGSGDPLDLQGGESQASVSRASTRDTLAAGIAVTRASSVGVWEELPRDSLGSLIGRSDLADRFARLLRIAAELLPPDGQVAPAVGLGPIQMISEGDPQDLGRRSQVSMRMSDGLIRVEAEDSVPADAVGPAAEEIARELASRLLLRFRAE